MVESKVRKWLHGRERRRHIALGMPSVPEYFETPSARRMQACIEIAHRCATMGMVFGGAGLGKTTSARKYAEENTAVWLVTMMASTSSIAACLHRVAEAVGLRGLPPYTSPAIVADAIVERVRGTEGLILVDEAQHLNQKALEAIRSIHDAAEIGVVLLGNEVIYTRMTGGNRSAEYAQLFSRIGARVKLVQPTKGDVKALCDAWGLDGHDERKLIGELSQRPGALRGVTKALQLAKLSAGDEKLSREHIMQAWENLGGDA